MKDEIKFEGDVTPEQFKEFGAEAKRIGRDVDNMIRVANGSSCPMSPPKPGIIERAKRLLEPREP